MVKIACQSKHREGDVFMGNSDAVKEKVQAQVKVWDTKVALLKAAAANASAGRKLQYLAQLRELENRVQAAKDATIAGMESGGKDWEEMSSGIEKALTALSEAAGKASDPIRH